MLENDKDLIGMLENEASDLAKKHGVCTRVSVRDGEHQAGTCDYRLDRINLVIKDGKVIGVSRG